jgi:hypothetical protein
MSKGRKLTPDEKAQISRWAHERESGKHPGASIQILVEDEIDDNGKVHYRVTAVTESIVSLEDLPE